MTDLSNEVLGANRCESCGHHILVDCVIDHATWATISPTGDEGGTLCANCMSERLCDKFGWPSVRMSSPDAITALRQQIEATEAAALERAAKVLNARGAEEQRNFGLRRETQNFFRARDMVRALITPGAASALEAVKAEARRAVVKVKPLVWVEGWGGRLEDTPIWEGRSSTGMSFGFSGAGHGYTTHTAAPAEWVASEKSRLDGIYVARIRAALEGGEG